MGVFGTAGAAGEGDRSRLGLSVARDRAAVWGSRLAPLVLALGTWRVWPVNSVHPSAGLDTSWKIGLHLAAAHGLVFGRDVTFTYGPLGFLTQPLTVNSTTGALSIAFSLLVWLALAAAVIGAARRSFAPVTAFVIAYLVLVLPNQIADALVLVAFLAAVGVFEDARARSPLLVAGAGAFAGVVLLVKLNDGILTFVIFALAVSGLPRLLRMAALLLASFAGSVVVLWVVTGNPIGALPDWLRATSHVLSGYSETMASEANGRWPQYVWAAALLVAAGILLALHLGRTRPALWLIAAVFVAAYLKEGFVRHDAHDLIFFAAFAAVLPAFRWRERRLRVGAAAVVVAAVAAVVATPEVGLGDLLRPVSSASAALSDARLVVEQGRLREEAASSRATIRSQLALPPGLVAALRGRTVAVVPEEVSAVWAYGLRWRPESTLQDYGAYDAYLDRLDAQEVASSGPARLLQAVRWPGVDGTHPLLEAPATAFARICHYRARRTSTQWTVLARTADRCGAPTLIARRTGRAGEAIEIPDPPRRGELVYACIGLRSSLSARLGNLLFKPVHLPKIVLGAVTYRFVAASADDPLVLRLPAGAGLPSFLGGAVDYARFTLLNVSSGFTVSFYAVPLDTIPRASLPAPPVGRIAGRAIVVGGRSIPLTAGAVVGSVDATFDWGRDGAVAGATAEPARVVVFVDGRLAALSTLSRDYRLEFRLAPAARVRVFAFTDGRASELAYGEGEPWPH